MQTHLQTTLSRHRLRKRSTQATAQALRAAAATLEAGSERARLLTWAARMELCARTTQSFVFNMPGQPLSVSRRKRRACRNRFCLDCEADRAAAHAAYLDRLLTQLWTDVPGAVLLFLTTTLKSYPLAELSNMLTALDKGTQRLHQLPRMRDATLGHYTVFEVALNELTPGQYTAHAHAHAFVAVAGTALADDRYIPQREYVRLWRHAALLHYKPVVDIRRAKGPHGDTSQAGMRAAIPELAKYVAMPGAAAYLTHHTDGRITMPPVVARTLASALYRRRMTRFNRCFAAAAKALARADRSKEPHSG